MIAMEKGNLLYYLLVTLLLLFPSVNYAKEKPIIVGTLFFDPPYEVMDGGGHYSGFNIDILEKLCAKLNRPCQIKAMSLEELEKAVLNGEVDIMLTGTHFSPLHPNQYTHSLPFFIGSAEFLAMPGTHFDSLDKKRIGVIKNTLIKMRPHYELHYEKVNNTLQKSTLNMYYYYDFGDLMAALRDKKVDAVLLPSGSVNYWNNNTEAPYQRVGPRVNIKNGMRIISNHEYRALIEKINEALLTLESDGEVLKLYKNHWHQIFVPGIKAAYLTKPHSTSNTVLPTIYQNFDDQ